VFKTEVIIGGNRCKLIFDVQSIEGVVLLQHTHIWLWLAYISDYCMVNWSL